MVNIKGDIVAVWIGGITEVVGVISKKDIWVSIVVNWKIFNTIIVAQVATIADFKGANIEGTIIQVYKVVWVVNVHDVFKKEISSSRFKIVNFIKDFVNIKKIDKIILEKETKHFSLENIHSKDFVIEMKVVTYL